MFAVLDIDYEPECKGLGPGPMLSQKNAMNGAPRPWLEEDCLLNWSNDKLSETQRNPPGMPLIVDVACHLPDTFSYTS